MSTSPLPIALLACQVFEDVIEHHLRGLEIESITFLDYGLHIVPKKLTIAVQDALDTLPEPHLVILGYGLCGKGLDDIRAGKHTLLIPRTDDCIAILLGSREAYHSQMDERPGTYYLTKGWLEAATNPLKEYHKLLEKYDEETADWIMDQQYQHYTRLAFVAHTEEDLEKYRPQAKEIAAYCAQWDMEYEELLGSEAYIRLLAEAAARISRSGGKHDPGTDFIVVQPGGTLKQAQFMGG